VIDTVMSHDNCYGQILDAIDFPHCDVAKYCRGGSWKAAQAMGLTHPLDKVGEALLE
jgi:hypothetical protein